MLETNPYEAPSGNRQIRPESVVEPWSGFQRKLFLLAAAAALFLPVSYVVVVTAGMISGVPVHSVPAYIGFVGLVGTAVQLPIYLVWTFISPELSLKRKIVWGTILLVINMFGIPMFLYAKYRRQTVSMWSRKT